RDLLPPYGKSVCFPLPAATGTQLSLGNHNFTELVRLKYPKPGTFSGSSFIMVNFRPPDSFNDLAFYSAHFMDPMLWKPFVHHVAVTHGYEYQHISPGEPGTFPTFIAGPDRQPGQPSQETIVVKFFGPLFDGLACFDVEQAMEQFIISQNMSIRSPAILARGHLSKEWSYLVFEHIPGVRIGQVRQELGKDALENVARHLGQYMHELHTRTATYQTIIPSLTNKISWDEYSGFLATQRENCVTNHQQWHDLPPHLIDQLPGFIPSIDQLIDLSSPPHLIHADLTADHLLGNLIPLSLNSTAKDREGDPQMHGDKDHPEKGWESLAIIDWGDCRVGNILYELAAVHTDLFQVDKHLLRLFMEVYGLPTFYQADFACKALSTVLLHQFPMPSLLYAPYRDTPSLYDVAEGIFGI
ncbi:MAG TPA: hypothetical protein VLD65_00540, partial [Anaerolineales bacterium]|nr:hypothetical protein [Anaerolineales bacterium]